MSKISTDSCCGSQYGKCGWLHDSLDFLCHCVGVWSLQRSMRCDLTMAMANNYWYEYQITNCIPHLWMCLWYTRGAGNITNKHGCHLNADNIMMNILECSVDVFGVLFRNAFVPPNNCIHKRGGIVCSYNNTMISIDLNRVWHMEWGLVNIYRDKCVATGKSPKSKWYSGVTPLWKAWFPFDVVNKTTTVLWYLTRPCSLISI